MAYRILVIDDTEDIRAIAALALELDPELDVRTCGSGREGVEIATWWQPDLVLLDVDMPEWTGPDTLKMLRSGAKTNAIPTVFFTASVRDDERQKKQELIDLGAEGVIAKPFDPMALAARVKPFIAAQARSVAGEAGSDASEDVAAPQERYKSLLYVSRSLLDAGDAGMIVRRIVDTAQAKNGHRGVTGALIFTHTHFAQYLEGPGSQVDELMALIRQDSRHTDVRLVPIPPFSRRYFSDWKMAYGGSSVFVSSLVTAVFGGSQAPNPEKLVRLMRELSNQSPE